MLDTFGRHKGMQFIDSYWAKAGRTACAETYLRWRWQGDYPPLPPDETLSRRQ